MKSDKELVKIMGNIPWGRGANIAVLSCVKYRAKNLTPNPFPPLPTPLLKGEGKGIMFLAGREVRIKASLKSRRYAKPDFAQNRNWAVFLEMAKTKRSRLIKPLGCLEYTPYTNQNLP
jgi:hypothetical protein